MRDAIVTLAIVTLRAMGRRVALLRAGAVLAAAAALAGCVSAAGGRDAFPPDRSAWQAAPIATQVAHARALESALETPAENSAHSWSSGDASGAVTVDLSWLVEDRMLCRRFLDSITIDGRSTELKDVACWTDTGWHYFRQHPGEPVLLPLLVEAAAR